MKNKDKGLISFFVLIISTYMMITTKHLNALGDYVLEAIGLRAWSNHNSGWHLTIIYFGVFFIIGLYCVRKYVIGLMQVRTRNVVLIFFASLTLLFFLTSVVAESVKGNSKGLLSIGYDSKSSNIDYWTEGGEYIQFDAGITLTNYSKENKEFYIQIQDFYDRDENINEIQIFELNGEPALFRLDGKQTKTFSITLEDYDLKSADKPENGGKSGSVEEMILKDINGSEIRLDTDSFLGMELSR